MPSDFCTSLKSFFLPTLFWEQKRGNIFAKVFCFRKQNNRHSKYSGVGYFLYSIISLMLQSRASQMRSSTKLSYLFTLFL